MWFFVLLGIIFFALLLLGFAMGFYILWLVLKFLAVPLAIVLFFVAGCSMF